MADLVGAEQTPVAALALHLEFDVAPEAGR